MVQNQNLAISSEVHMTWGGKVNRTCFLLVKDSDVFISHPHPSRCYPSQSASPISSLLCPHVPHAVIKAACPYDILLFFFFFFPSRNLQMLSFRDNMSSYSVCWIYAFHLISLSYGLLFLLALANITFHLLAFLFHYTVI